jgi:hypothetical protein
MSRYVIIKVHITGCSELLIIAMKSKGGPKCKIRIVELLLFQAVNKSSACVDKIVGPHIKGL